MLNLLAGADDGLTVTEVGLRLGLPKSSAHRYLSVLEAYQFAERDNHNRYRIGLGMLLLQSRRAELLVQYAQPYMENLRDQFGETVNLGILSRNRIACVALMESTKSVRHSVRRGDEEPLHSTALGKAVAASLSEREVLELLVEAGMERRTSKTITDPSAFLEVLKEVREKGYAVDDGENEEEARCVAVLIPGLNIPAAISVSGVASRFSMSEVKAVAQALKDVVAQLEAKLSPA